MRQETAATAKKDTEGWREEMEEQGEERGRATANIHAWNQQIHIKYDFLNNLRIHAEMWQNPPDTNT